jgi:gluconate 2-dehydrogenase gamma chain
MFGDSLGLRGADFDKPTPVSRHNVTPREVVPRIAVGPAGQLEGDMSDKMTRRSFVGAVSAATAIVGGPALAASAAGAQAAKAAAGASHTHAAPYLFFNPEEARFIEAACERLIPADAYGPGALQAGVPTYLDRQLGGAWGAGERLYRSGPWSRGTPSQGYQLPHTPAELFHSALKAIRNDFERQGTAFHALPPEQQDRYLKSLETGGGDLGDVPAAVFFDLLLKMTIEGFFSDPVYGGNRDMAAWKMIGFPGAYADYYEAIDRHGVAFQREPMSLGEDAVGHVHMNPNIPAKL